MKSITTRLALIAVVLTVALSMMAAPAVAVPADKVTVTDPDRMDDHAKKGVMPGDNVQMDVPGQGDERFPDFLFDGGDKDGSDPVITK